MKIYIDASNAWYRAYLATNLDPPGGPVLIMTYMLRRICNEYGKNNVIICWDGGSKERKLLDPQYKAQRQHVAGVWDDIHYMNQMVNCLGLTNARLEGCEADDVIGSLITQSKENCRILSYDKDFYQLVQDRVQIVRPERTIKGKKISQQIIDEKGVMEEFGCSPIKTILIKSFKGDPSDNIPKISIRFTKTFNGAFYKVVEKSTSLEEVYNNLNFFDKKYHQELLQFKERAFLNEALIKIKTNLNIAIDTPRTDRDAFEKLCKEIKITKLKFSDWESCIVESPAPSPVQNSLF